MLIDATVGGANANSYVTLAEANAYFANRLHAEAWVDADDEQRERALITATRLIDSDVCFVGASVDAVQALRWPLSGMFTRNGFPIAINEIPRDLKYAVFELALILLSTDRTVPSDTFEQGIERIKAGPVEIEYKDGTTAPNTVPDKIRSLFPESWLCEENDNVMELEVL